MNCASRTKIQLQCKPLKCFNLIVKNLCLKMFLLKLLIYKERESSENFKTMRFNRIVKLNFKITQF